MDNGKYGYVDLEVRTFEYAKNIRLFIRETSKTLVNLDDLKQLLRSN